MKWSNVDTYFKASDYQYYKLGMQGKKQYLEIYPIAAKFHSSSFVELKGRNVDETINACLKFFELDVEYDVIFKNGEETISGKMMFKERITQTSKDYVIKWNTSVNKQNDKLIAATKRKIAEEEEVLRNLFLDDSEFQKNRDELLSFRFYKIDDNLYEIEVANDCYLKEDYGEGIALGRQPNIDTDVDLIGIGSYLLGLQEPLKVPTYQRDFVWSRDQIRSLFNDIENTIKNGAKHFHYMGSIYLYNGNIVDGQQRLTTTLLTLLVLLDDEAHNNLKVNYGYKIVFNKFVNIYWKKYFEDHKIDKPDSKDKVLLNVPINEIIKSIDDLEERGISKEQIRDCICDNLLISVIDLSNNEKYKLEEIEVFESLNNRGKPLSSYDLIRSLLVQNSQDKFDTFSMRIEERGSDSPIADVDKLLGYFRHYVAIQTGDLCDLSLSSHENVYRGYMNYLLKKYKTTDLKDEDFYSEIDNIKDYFECFDAIKSSDNFYIKWLLYAQEELIEIIATLKLEHVESFEDNLKVLVNYVIRVLLSQTNYGSYTATSISNNLLDKGASIMFYLKEEVKQINNKNRYYKDIEILPDRPIFNTTGKKILCLYAYVMYKDNMFKVPDIQLEHIYPESKAKNVEGIAAKWMCIGNMSILEDTINGAKLNSDKDYKDKKVYYQRSELEINKKILEEFPNDDITVEDIQQRSEKICQVLLNEFQQF